MKQKLFIFVLFAFICHSFVSCIATTNYYTGKTLDKGKMVFTPGFDNLYIKNNDEDIKIDKKPFFTPSFGIAIGLPFRFETGLRYYPRHNFESSLRWDATPKSFSYFDFSINGHFGYNVGNYSYFKYGITLSKDINNFEPFISYYQYSFLDVKSDELSDMFFSGSYGDMIDENRNITFGVAIPIKKAKVFPEFIYQYYKNGFKNGILYFSVGLRAELK